MSIHDYLRALHQYEQTTLAYFYAAYLHTAFTGEAAR